MYLLRMLFALVGAIWLFAMGPFLLFAKSSVASPLSGIVMMIAGAVILRYVYKQNSKNSTKKPFWEYHRRYGPPNEKGFLKVTRRYVDEANTVSTEHLERYDDCAEDYIRPTGIHKLITENAVEEHRMLALEYLASLSKRGFQSCLTKEDVNRSHDDLIISLKWDCMSDSERSEIRRSRQNQ